MTSPFAKWFKMPSLGDRLRKWGVREDLVIAAENTAFGRQGDRGLADLAERLTDDERVVRLMEARYGKAVGVLTLTSRRLIFLTLGGLKNSETQIDLADVIHTAWEQRRGMGTVKITTRDQEEPTVFDQILGTQAEWLCADIGAAKDPDRAPAPPSTPETGAAPTDPLKLLAELRAVHDAGLIDDDEYERRKAELIKKL